MRINRYLLISLLISISFFTFCGEDKNMVTNVGNDQITSSGQTAELGGVFVKVGVASGDGTSWTKAFKNLQDGIDEAKRRAAAENKIIKVYVAQGTYKPTKWPHSSGSDRNKHFALSNNVEVYGGFPGQNIGESKNSTLYKTTLSGDIGVAGDSSDNVYNVFYHPLGIDSTAKLDGVTITKGNSNGASPMGGGMYNMNSSPSLVDCIFEDNKAMFGGGMANRNSHPVLKNCTFKNNEANLGGGMYNTNSSDPMLEACNLENNTANFQGGGIYNDIGSRPVYKNNTLNNNTPQDIYDKK